MQNQQQQNQATSHDKLKIWSGTVEWIDKLKPDHLKIPRAVNFSVTTNIKNGEPEIKADNWPSKLFMQMMPKHLVANIGGQYLKDSKMVVLVPTPCEALDALLKVMNNGFAGCVHFTSAMSACDIKVLLLLYSVDKNMYLGFIPNNQTMFVDRLRKVIHQKQIMGQQQQQPTAGPMQQQQQQQQQQQNQATSHDKLKIWSGTVEWIDKLKPDHLKIPRAVNFSVITNIQNGEPEIKADNWPSKLFMQMIPKHLIANMGGQYLKESKMVFFVPTPCEALDALLKAINNGFVGCVHVGSDISACDIKIILLMYSVDKNTFFGLIHNNQTMFVDRLRNEIHQNQIMQQQQQQQMLRGTGGLMQQNSMPLNVLAQQQQQEQQNLVPMVPNVQQPQREQVIMELLCEIVRQMQIMNQQGYEE